MKKSRNFSSFYKMTALQDMTTDQQCSSNQFIKPVAGFLVSPVTLIINNDINGNSFPDALEIARIS